MTELHGAFLPDEQWQYILCALEADFLRYRSNPDRWSHGIASDLYSVWQAVRCQLGLAEEDEMRMDSVGVQKAYESARPRELVSPIAVSQGEKTEQWTGPIGGGGGA